MQASLTSAAAQVPGEAVVLEQKDGASWDVVGIQATGTDGLASFTVTLGSTDVTVRARYAGSTALAPTTSGPATVAATQVASALFIHGPTRLVDETRSRLLMRWTGADGLPVTGTVSVYQHAKGKPWSKLGTLRTSSTGRAEVQIAPRVDMSYQFRGMAAPGWKAATSPTWSVNNVPPGSVVVLPKGAPKPIRLDAQRRGVGTGAHVAVAVISDAVWKRMYGRSWKPGCPVGRSELRYLTTNYWGFDGYRHRGELVVRAGVASKFSVAMTKLYNARVPIRAMFLPDRFGYSGQSHGANDYASMRHDNTSAFNCRLVTGDAGLRSPHSYGAALDINTWENPFRSKDGWLPNNWWSTKQVGTYAWKSRNSTVVTLMRQAGFSWPYGASDAQHFSA